MDARESNRQLKESISAWLVATKDVEIRVGLSDKDAKRQARSLIGAILEGSVRPESTVVDDNVKQVLSVAVALLREFEAEGEAKLREADAVYKFIERVPWPEDPLDEKRDLLIECAEIGWGAVGLSLSDVARRRCGEGAESAIITQYTTDPILPVIAIIRMPNTARVLKFPSRPRRVSLRPGEALGVAEQFLATQREDRVQEACEEALANPDVLMAVLGLLGKRRDAAPDVVAEEATFIYGWLKTALNVGVFDERDYFLGETAYLAGSACRALGLREDAARWLDRAESHFRHALNPAPNMANIAYTRLALAFETGRFDDLLELMPSLRLSFERLGMAEEVAKCLLLEAMTLKKTGKSGLALELLQPVREWEASKLAPGLRGRIFSEIGDLYQVEDRFDDAMFSYQQALAAFEDTEVSQGRADLKAFVGEAFRTRGRFETALEAFRSAVADYSELRIANRVAYLRVYVADILLNLDRPREAEWELLAALPTIEEQKMVPEGFAAVALLKESVRRRKTDPNALRELREHLQAANQK